MLYRIRSRKQADLIDYISTWLGSQSKLNEPCKLTEKYLARIFHHEEIVPTGRQFHIVRNMDWFELKRGLAGIYMCVKARFSQHHNDVSGNKVNWLRR